MLFSLFLKTLARLRWHGGNPDAIALQEILRLQQNGAAARAHELCEQLLQRSPENIQARYELGKMLAQAGRYECALAHLRRAAELAPECADVHSALGNVFNLMGNGSAAEDHYRRALLIDADNVLALYNLGLLLKLRAEYADALLYFERTCCLAPELDDALKERVLCLIHLGRFDEALKVLHAVLLERPSSRQIWNYQGYVQQKMHNPQAALRSYEHALNMEMVDADLFNNTAIVLQELGRLDEAVTFYDRAIAEYADPKLKGLPKFHKALARLLRGDFRAWPEYEIRLQSEDLADRPRKFPRWNGDDLTGRTLLVYGEQGLGDEIMFASCLPDVIAQAEHCVIECSSKLEGLFRHSFPGATVYAPTHDRKLPPHIEVDKIDAEVPIGSLPLHFRRKLEEFPPHRGYLQAVSEHIARWRERLGQLGPGVKVGISWKGGTHKTRSPLRSIKLESLLPILRCENAQFISLQYSDVAAELSVLRERHGIVITQWSEAIVDYEQTAALVCALDLVISVCTSIIHLGGALGKPVWVMTPYSPEWRYGLSGETMPWYPSVRLFRQPAFGQWEPVIGDIVRSLRAMDMPGIEPSNGERCHGL